MADDFNPTQVSGPSASDIDRWRYQKALAAQQQAAAPKAPPEAIARAMERESRRYGKDYRCEPVILATFPVAEAVREIEMDVRVIAVQPQHVPLRGWAPGQAEEG